MTHTDTSSSCPPPVPPWLPFADAAERCPARSALMAATSAGVAVITRDRPSCSTGSYLCSLQCRQPGTGMKPQDLMSPPGIGPCRGQCSRGTFRASMRT